MRFNGQRELGYKLADLSNTLSPDLPSSSDKLAVWLEQLPMLNIDQLLHQVPSYLQELNQFKLADSMRFKMLEMLRPVAKHIYREIIKRFRSEKGLNLSVEFQEMEWLVNVLLREMALGYQRLLFNKAAKTPRFYNRSYYATLNQRVMFYLGERVAFIYMFHGLIPQAIWHDLNSSYRYARYLKLSELNVKDDFALEEGQNSTVTTIYKRLVLLSIISPYSLRSAEIEQVYLGLLPLIAKIKFTKEIPENKNSYMINWEQDQGPLPMVIEHKESKNWFIDTSELITELSSWIVNGQSKYQGVDQGISVKFLAHIQGMLDGSSVRRNERTPVKGRQVEVIIGLKNIEVFLGHIEAVKNDQGMTVEELHVDEFTVNHQWNEKVTDGDWDSLVFNPIDKVKPDFGKHVKEEIVAPERRYYFDVENESAGGMSLHCNAEQAKGLVIGELILLFGSDIQTWTLGIIRWSTVANKKVYLGVYFLGEQIDFVNVKKADSNQITNKVLWLEGKGCATSLLMPTGKFLPREVVTTFHDGIELTLMLQDSIWQNDVFSQFRFELVNIEKQDL